MYAKIKTIVVIAIQATQPVTARMTADWISTAWIANINKKLGGREMQEFNMNQQEVPHL